MQRPAPPAFQIKSTTAVIATLAIATASLVAVRAQQAPAPAARPMVPVAASSVAAYPDTYLGENVSVMAAVEALLSKTAFTIDQDKTKSTGKDVLVLAPTLTGVVQPNTYVTVVGEVIRFDPAEVAKRLKGYTIDLPRRSRHEVPGPAGDSRHCGDQLGAARRRQACAASAHACRGRLR